MTNISIFRIFSSIFFSRIPFGFQNNNHLNVDANRYISRNNGHKSELLLSPGYDDNASNSTLSAASPDSAYAPYNSNESHHSLASNQSWPDKSDSPASTKITIKPRSSPRINLHVANFETKYTDHENGDHADEHGSSAAKIVMPKIDISSRRELFEREQRQSTNQINEVKRPIELPQNTENSVSIRERLTHLERCGEENRDSNGKTTKSNRSSGNFDDTRHSFTSTGSDSQFVNIEPRQPKIDVQIVPLKERLMTLELSMANETPAYNNRVEQRPAKRAEVKPAGPANPTQTGVEQTKSPSKSSRPAADDLRSSHVTQPSQRPSHLPINARSPIAPKPTKPEQSTPAAVRKPEVLPRRQITPDLVRVTPMAETEDDLLQSQDEIDDDADNSVSVSSASSKAIIPNLVNLTIKSILVNSIDLSKASSILSTSTSSLVMGTKSNLANVHSSSNNNPSVDQCDHMLHEQRQTVAECAALMQCTEPKTTDQCAQRTAYGAQTIDAIVSSGQAAGNEAAQAKNERIKCQIVGVLEKNKVKEPTAHASDARPKLLIPSTPSPKMANKSPTRSPNKPKNIFDFFKRNFLNEPPIALDAAETDADQSNVSLGECEPLTASVDTVDGFAPAHESNDAKN